MTFPKFPEFLQNSQTMRMYLQIEDISISHQKTTLPLKQVKSSQINSKVTSQIAHPAILPLPPVFLHMSFLLIQSLCETGYGEFAMIAEKKNHQFAVYPSTHIRDRYLLDFDQIKSMKDAYHQITQQWSKWYSSR